MSATSAYLCFDCYKKEIEQYKKDMKEMEERLNNGVSIALFNTKDL